MTWEEFNPIDVFQPAPYTPVPVKCPYCGEEIWRDNQFVLTSNPPKYQYVCLACGWTDYK